eukprot:scaffold96089_cov65-Phaeocystis_antarctica.AAC.1
MAMLAGAGGGKATQHPEPPVALWPTCARPRQRPASSGQGQAMRRLIPCSICTARWTRATSGIARRPINCAMSKSGTSRSTTPATFGRSSTMARSWTSCYTLTMLM